MNFDHEDAMFFASEFALMEDLVPSNAPTDNFVSPTSFAAFVFGSPEELSASREPYNFIEPLEDNDEEPRSIQADVASEAVIDNTPHPHSDSGSVGAGRELTVFKPRIRRPGKPRIEPQNKFGRGGVPRCARCRRHRQKCVYDDENAPCKLCASKGFECGQKLWGFERENRLVVPSTSSVLRIERPAGPTNEMLYDDAVLCKWSRSRSQYRRAYPHFFVPYLSVMPENLLNLVSSSDMLRSAILSLAWLEQFLFTGRGMVQSIKSLGRCVHLFRRSLSGSPTLETFCVCYALFWWSVESHHKEEALTHLSGLFRVASALRTGNISITDSHGDWIECRLLNSLSLAEQLIFGGFRRQPVRASNVAKDFHRIIQITQPDFELELAMADHSKPSYLRRKLAILSVHINYLFMLYLDGGSVDHASNISDVPRIEIVSVLLTFLDEFLQLLTIYDHRVVEFVDASSTGIDPALVHLGRSHYEVVVMLGRVQSYCLASFLQYILGQGLVDRTDPRHYQIGMMCIRAFALQGMAITGGYSRVLPRQLLYLSWVLLPASEAPEGDSPAEQLTEKRMCTIETSYGISNEALG